MTQQSVPLSFLRVALVAAIVTGLSGCSWFRAKSEWEKSPESRSLEVPPDLDTPRTDPAMAIPSVAPVAATPAVQAAPSAAFVITDTVDGTWRRLGLALERIEGVSVTQKAQALSAYSVSYSGEEFLVRVVAAGAQSRVEAVDGSGAVVNAGAAGQLLGLLKARLG